MAYTPPVYPSAIPSQTGTGADLPDRIDDIDWLYAARYNELKKEIIAIMTELGTLPKGYATDVKTRLATINPSSGNISGNGFQFPSVQVPSADVNNLDYYKEGTWTGALVCGTSGTITLDNNYKTGAYVKIGRLVVITGRFNVGSVSSPIGDLILTGLPFTSATGNQFFQSISVYANALETTAKTSIMGFLEGNASQIFIYRFENGSIAVSAAIVKAGSDFMISGSYFTA